MKPKEQLNASWFIVAAALTGTAVLLTTSGVRWYLKRRRRPWLIDRRTA